MNRLFPRILLRVAATFVVVAALALAARAQQPGNAAPAPGAEAEKKAPAKAAELTVAILDFTSDTPEGAETGKQIADIVTTSLHGVDGLTPVDRTSIANALREQELNLAGLVQTEGAPKFGRMVGAKLLVSGKVFVVDGQLHILVKVVSSETTRVDGLLVKGEKGVDFSTLAIQLADKLATRLREKGPKLIAVDDAEPDPLPALKEKLAKLRKPVLAVHVDERHVGAPRGGGGGDPAVETEVRKMLLAVGFKIIDGGEREQAEGGVELVIAGDAFSEFAGRINNLLSCSARVELKVTNRKTGELIFTERETTRAADLSEAIAGKTALEKGGRVVGLRLIQHFVDTLKPAEGGGAK